MKYNYEQLCHPNLLWYYISTEGNLSPNTKDCDGAEKVGASAVGGFVGGVLITAVLGIGIHLLFVRRMRLAHMKCFSKLIIIRSCSS